MTEPTTSVPAAGPSDRLMTPGEVARIFRVSSKTVTRWCQPGPNGKPPRLSSVRTPGGQHRILESVVRDLLRSFVERSP